MSYHYAECGLDYVYLENGYAYHDTAYGKGVAIAHLDGLHAAIGKWVIEQPAALRGAELRFLRLEIELTQRGLADILGTTEQTLRLWEKGHGKAIPGPADRLLRALYLEFLDRAGGVREMVARLAKADSQRRPVARMRETRRGWTAKSEFAEAVVT